MLASLADLEVLQFLPEWLGRWPLVYVGGMGQVATGLCWWQHRSCADVMRAVMLTGMFLLLLKLSVLCTQFPDYFVHILFS